jgi:hypothetical protein
MSWENEQVPHVALTYFYFIQDVTIFKISGDCLLFQQGKCIYAIYDYGITYVINSDSDLFLTGAVIKGNDFQEIGYYKKITVSDSTDNLSDKTIFEYSSHISNGEILEYNSNINEGIKTLGKNKTLRFTYDPKEKQTSYKTLDNKYVFNMDDKHDIVNYVEVEGGLIVMASLKNEAVETSEENESDYLFKIQKQCNVLICVCDEWHIHFMCKFNNGILQYVVDKWFYISIENHFQIIFEPELDLELKENFCHGLIDFVTLNNEVFVKCIASDESNDPDANAKNTRIADSVELMAKLFRVKTIENNVPVKFEKLTTKKSLVQTPSGFYRFIGDQFVPYHEETNLLLRSLSEKQLKIFSAYMLDKDLLGENFVSELKEISSASVTNLNLNRSYDVVQKHYGDVTIAFIEGESYLERALLAKKVHMYNSRINFTLLGSFGGGPVKVIANQIIKEFVETYFKFDGPFLIPNNLFRNLPSNTKFELGWLLHNILHLIKKPICHHLPFALLSALIQRKPNIFELEPYAKVFHEQMYLQLNSMNESDLKQAGYETRFEWISMLCRYSDDDLILYEDFARGFRSFSQIDPLKDVNIPTADHFISGSRSIDVTDLVDKLTRGTALLTDFSKKFSEKIIDKLLNESQDKLRTFVFNLTGTHHLSGNESIRFENVNFDYKFSVCSNLLTICEKIQMENLDLVLEELFEVQQARMLD